MSCSRCHETLPTGAQGCPRCGEPVRPTREREWVSTALTGAAVGLFLTGVAGRLLAAGPVPESAAVARSLEFIEATVGASFLLWLARLARRR